jgi:hypothetical protein
MTMADIGRFLNLGWDGREFTDLAEAPIAAIQGLSKEDAEALRKALSVTTVRDLATNKYVLVAQAIVALSDAQQIALKAARAADAVGDPVQAATGDKRSSGRYPSDRRQTTAGQAEAASEAFAG